MTLNDENKRFYKNILYLAPPMIVQEILNTSINLLDTVMIGKRLGAADIAAVGISNQVFFLFAIVLFGVNSGSSIFIGQYWGKDDVKSVKKTMGIAFMFNTIVSTLFTFIALFGSRIAMGLFSRDEAVIALGMDYLWVIGFSYIFTAMTVTRNAALKATGNTRLPMVLAFISLLTNFVFNYITIYILNMGVVGAALSTLIARVIENVAQHILIYRLKTPIAGSFKEYFSFDFAYVKAFLKITMFVILNESIWALGISTYNIAYSYCGTNSQAAFQIGLVIMQIFMVFGMAVGTSTSIMLSNALGAGERERAIRYSRKCLKLTFLVSSVMAFLLIMSSPLVVGFFDNVEMEVREITSKLMYAIAIAMIPKALNYTALCGALRSGGDTKFCFILESVSVWFLGVPLGFLGALYFKLPIYWVLVMTYSEEVVKFIFALYRVLSNKWANTLV